MSLASFSYSIIRVLINKGPVISTENSWSDDDNSADFLPENNRINTEYKWYRNRRVDKFEDLIVRNLSKAVIVTIPIDPKRQNCVIP